MSNSIQTGTLRELRSMIGSMGSKFDLPHPERSLKICVVAIDEAWEFWLCERGRRLTLGAIVQIDRAVEIWREGKDPIALMADRLRAGVERGEIGLPADGHGPECRTH